MWRVGEAVNCAGDGRTMEVRYGSNEIADEGDGWLGKRRTGICRLYRLE